jgi:hypothetical protein
MNLWVLFKSAVSIATNNHSSKILYHKIVVFMARKWGAGVVDVVGLAPNHFTLRKLFSLP